MTYNDKAEDLKSKDAAEGYACSIALFCHLNYPLYPDIYSNRQCNIENEDKAEKERIVTLSNTSAQPDAMMVEASDATIA